MTANETEVAEVEKPHILRANTKYECRANEMAHFGCLSKSEKRLGYALLVQKLKREIKFTYKRTPLLMATKIYGMLHIELSSIFIIDNIYV